MFCLNAFFILIMIGKTIWLGIVWLQHPFAMVPYLYESFIPSSSRSFICWRRILANQELGTAHLRDRTLGTNMVAHPIWTWPWDPAIHWWRQPIEVMDWPMPPFLSIAATTPLSLKVVHRHPGSTPTAISVATFTDWDPCHWRVTLSVVSSMREPALRKMTRKPSPP